MLLYFTAVFTLHVHCMLMPVVSFPAIKYVTVCFQIEKQKAQTVQCGVAILLLGVNPDFM